MIDGIFFADAVMWPMPKWHKILAKFYVFLPFRTESIWVKFPGIGEALRQDYNSQERREIRHAPPQACILF